MHVEFLHSQLVEGSRFFLALREGVQRLVVFRMRFIIEAGFRLHALLNAGMHNGTSDKIVDRRVLGCFFSQSL